MISWTQLVGDLVLPPVGILLLLGLIAVLGRRWFSASLTVLLLALCTPFVADHLVRTVEIHPPLELEALPSGPQAIVILGGGIGRDHALRREDLTAFSKARVEYGAVLAKTAKLPVLVSGGMTGREPESEAWLMAERLRALGVNPRWLERYSRNTAENARNSASTLSSAGIEHVYLVTNAFHMPRAVEQFELAGLTITPAPMGYLADPGGEWSWVNGFPNPRGLIRSYYALHEWLGRLWYWLAE